MSHTPLPEFCRHLKTMPVEPASGQKRFVLLPRMPCETRLGTMVFMMRDVLRCLPAITQTVVDDVVTIRFGGNAKVQEMRGLVLDKYVIQGI